jgi:glutathione S-transferase
MRLACAASLSRCYFTFRNSVTAGAKAAHIRARLAQLETALADGGPWFAGERFSLVDAMFGPVFRYFDVFDELGDFRFFEGLPRTSAWRAALAGRASVREAAHPDYPASLHSFLRGRGSALSQRMILAATKGQPSQAGT